MTKKRRPSKDLSGYILKRSDTRLRIARPPSEVPSPPPMAKALLDSFLVKKEKGTLIPKKPRLDFHVSAELYRRVQKLRTTFDVPKMVRAYLERLCELAEKEVR